MFVGLVASPASHPVENIQDFIDKTVVSGHLRSYFFTRDYVNPQPYQINQQAFSLGGYIGLITPKVYNFQLGTTLYAANSLGLNPKNPDQIDTTLPGNTLYVLGEKFLQYKNDYLVLRGPDQVIDTPWIGPADGRMLQSTFRGFYGSVTPLKDVSIVGIRLTDFKGRDEGNFVRTNLYYPDHAGGSPVDGLHGHNTSGAQAFSLQYALDSVESPLKAQLWWNQFFDFSNLWWLDAQYLHKTRRRIDPLIGIQFGSQSGDGANYLEKYAQKGPAGNTALFGVIAGVDLPSGRLTVAYNKITAQKGAFANGDILSPYSTGYATDPLYTTSMIGGMVEKQAPGDAFKVTATWFAMEKRIKALGSFAAYYTEPYVHNQTELNLDMTYSFPNSHPLTGLTIRDRFGLLTGNPTYTQFYYNRVMIQYSF